MADDRGESDPLEALTSKIDFKMNLLNDVMAEHREVKQVISGVMKEKESLQQEKERLQQEKERLLHDSMSILVSSVCLLKSISRNKNGEALARMKADLLSSKKTLAEARDALVSSSEVISQKDKYVEFLKKKLQESEAKNNQAEQQGGTKPIEPGEVQTRSMQKRKRPSEGPLDYDTGTNEPTSQLDDRSLSPLESLGNPNVQTRPIKMKRRLSQRTLGNDADNLEAIKEGPRQEVANNPTVGQTSGVQLCDEDDLEAIIEELIKEIVNLDDDKLQELKRVWGQDAHNAVVTALVEMKEYDHLSDRSIAYELWNYKEGRKATMRECVEYLFNQVKLLSASKRRNTLRRIYL
ncbi:unnamed protein product [Miscanthus lutarioriparius]|uniref:Factor of DNA methylation 1-5/IDN2 domain-containing protein n=1 Tax=Miscanthus lutarioriparius TaxID=422564 RepID=A0A811RID7_9POAL|nr:unnamed protein product [Miscanthus lutarioriparius]